MVLSSGDVYVWQTAIFSSVTMYVYDQRSSVLLMPSLPNLPFLIYWGLNGKNTFFFFSRFFKTIMPCVCYEIGLWSGGHCSFKRGSNSIVVEKSFTNPTEKEIIYFSYLSTWNSYVGLFTKKTCWETAAYLPRLSGRCWLSLSKGTYPWNKMPGE